MLFNSYSFIFLFLPLVLAGYYLLGRFGVKAAAGWLAIASLFFYSYWDISFLPLLLGSIIFNYGTGCLIDKAEGRQRKLWLAFGVVVNILLLGYYKYTGFLLNNINEFLQAGLTVPAIILPIGISFFTFTQTAYLVDLYRRETNNTSFVYYVEFVTIFPHLIAGPIISHKEMLPQFLNPDNLKVNYHNLANGLLLFSLGLGKKVIIADSLAIWANYVFAHSQETNILMAWIGSLSYTIQLYFDFSGYSEMAVGLGMMLNLKFPRNFNSPYQATSFIDLWRRWHMTLGQWVRDYIYIPLGGNRRGECRKYMNLLTAMIIIGIWHGAGWTYVIWGTLHGLLLLVNHGWRYLGGNIPKILAMPMTFLAWNFGQTIFRADSLSDAWNLIRNMWGLGNLSTSCEGLPLGWFSLGEIIGRAPTAGSVELIWGCLATLSVLLLLLFFVPNPQTLVEKYNLTAHWQIMAVTMIILTISLMCMTTSGEFLYFQF